MIVLNFRGDLYQAWNVLIGNGLSPLRRVVGNIFFGEV